MAEMADGSSDDISQEAEASRPLAYLAELQPGLRASAILDSAGSVLAATPPDQAWIEPALRLLSIAGIEADGSAVELHLAAPSGEVFAVREGGRTMIAISERFVLASLLTFDMRMVLRSVDGGPVAT